MKSTDGTAAAAAFIAAVIVASTPTPPTPKQQQFSVCSRCPCVFTDTTVVFRIVVEDSSSSARKSLNSSVCQPSAPFSSSSSSSSSPSSPKAFFQLTVHSKCSIPSFLPSFLPFLSLFPRHPAKSSILLSSSRNDPNAHTNTHTTSARSSS